MRWVNFKEKYKKERLANRKFDNGVPIFAQHFEQFSWLWSNDTSRTKSEKHITIDSIRELRELTEIKIKSKQSDLLVGGGVPKNFVQDTVVFPVDR